MIGNDRFVQVFGSFPAGDADDALAGIVSNAVREGYAIVLLKPGEKIPLCILNTRERKAADTAVQNAAREIGDDRWAKRKHDCGKSHALTVEWAGGHAKVRTKVGALLKRITREYGDRTPNIGVELGLSRRLVIDVDTEAEARAFLADCAAHDPDVPGMTVQSPGVVDDNGVWKHKDGGHYWMTLPEGCELPSSSGSYRSPSGWVAMWADHYVLVPPSVRPEGAYVLVGTEMPARAWVLDEIRAGAKSRMDRSLRNGVLPDGTADIDVWAAGTPWGDLLEGWTDTGLPDRCSCPIWTAPGVHASPKSATAHDVGCDRFGTEGGHAPIHLWTDSLPDWLAEAVRRTGQTTYTKPQWLAWRDHDGAILPTLRDLGLTRESDPEFPGYGDVPESDMFDPAGVEPIEPEPAEQPFDDADETAEPAPDVPEPTRADVLRSRMIGSAGLDDLPEPEPLIEGFLDIDTVARMTGKSGHGKSFVMLDMAGCIATGRAWHGAPVKQGLVVYMVAEGTRGWKRRMRSWEARHNDGVPIPDSGFLIVPFPIQTSSALDWHTFVTVLADLHPVLVILDTQARVTVGVDENDATAMGVFVEKLEGIRRATGACVIAVHHLGHQGEHGRGSTAVLGALGAELRVVKVSKGHLTVETEKQKDGEEHEPLKFLLDPEGESVVVMPDGWNPDDPFDAPPPVPVVDETATVRDRLAAVLWHMFGSGRGATKAEAMGVLTRGDTPFGKFGKSSVYRAWTSLEKDGVLIDGSTPSRFRLRASEAKRLSLGDPQLPDTPPPTGGQP